jgi:hypothetical protein
MNGRLSVTSDSSFNGNLFVGGRIVNSWLDASLNAGMSTVAPSFTGLVRSAGDVSLNSRLSVLSDVSFSSKLFVGSGISSQSLEPLSLTTNLDIGANQTNGTLNIGTNNSRSGDINIGTGTNMKWVNICSQGNGVVRIKGSQTYIGDSSTNFINVSTATNGSIDFGRSANTINMASDSTFTTVNIATASNMQGYVQIANGTGTIGAGTRLVHIGKLGVGEVRIEGYNSMIDCAAAGRVDVGTSSNTGSVSIGTGMTTGYVSVGGSSSTLYLNGKLISSHLDASFNSKVSSVAPSFTGLITSAGDVSMNGRLSVTSDSSFNANLFVGSGILSQSLEPLSSTTNLNIGANQTNGTLNIGTNNSRSGDINIGTGTNMKWVNICSQGNGVVRIKGSQTWIGDSSTNFINVSTATNGSIDFGRSANTINMASDSTFTTVNIATASNMQGYVQIANGSGTQGSGGRGVYIGKLGVGEVRIEGYNSAIDCAAAGRVDVGTSSNTGSVSIGTGMTTGYVSVGGSSSTLYLNGKLISSHLDASFNTRAPLASPALTGVPTAPTAAVANSSTQIATTAFVAGEINALINSAPGALNTLNELATALGNDAAFSTTVTNSLASKAPLATPSFTGTIISAGDVSMNSRLFINGDASLNSKLFVRGDVSFNGNLSVGGNVYSKSIYANSNSYVNQLNIGLNYDYFYDFDRSLINLGMAGRSYDFYNNGITETYDSSDRQSGVSSISFNGTNQYLTTTNFTFKNTGFSIAFWAKLNVPNGQVKPVIKFVDPTNPLTYIYLFIYPNQVFYFTYMLNNVTQRQVFSSVTNGDNTWRHYVFTMSYNSANPSLGTMNCYVNGALEMSLGSAPFPSLSTTFNISIARDVTDGYTIAKLDQLIIENDVITASDAAKMYAKTNVIESIDTNTGELVVNGGVGIGSNLNVGGNVSFNSGLYAFGNSYMKQIDVGLGYDYLYRFDNNLVNSGLAGPAYNFSNVGTRETYSSTDFQIGTSSITFNGTNRYLTFPNFTFKNTGFSIAFWGKFDVSSNMSSPIFNIQDVSNSLTVLTSYIFAGNNLYVNYNLNGVAQSSIFASGVNGDNTWRHYLYTMSYSATNTGTMKAFVNGSLVSTVSNTYFPNIASTYNFYLATNSVHYLIGRFDQIIIQNNVINDADALKIYNKSAGIYNSVVGTASTDIKTGELVVNGGAGIGGNVNVGGNLIFNSPLYPNYSLTSLNSSFQYIGFQKTATATTTAITSSASNIVSTNVSVSGTYQVEGWIAVNYSGVPSSGTWIRIGLSTTSATFDFAMTNDSYVLSSGNFYSRINSVIQTSASSDIYLIGQRGGTAPASTVTANVKITKLA